MEKPLFHGIWNETDVSERHKCPRPNAVKIYPTGSFKYLTCVFSKDISISRVVLLAEYVILNSVNIFKNLQYCECFYISLVKIRLKIFSNHYFFHNLSVWLRAAVRFMRKPLAQSYSGQYFKTIMAKVVFFSRYGPYSKMFTHTTTLHPYKLQHLTRVNYNIKSPVVVLF